MWADFWNVEKIWGDFWRKKCGLIFGERKKIWGTFGVKKNVG